VVPYSISTDVVGATLLYFTKKEMVINRVKNDPKYI